MTKWSRIKRSTLCCLRGASRDAHIPNQGGVDVSLYSVSFAEFKFGCYTISSRQFTSFEYHQSYSDFMNTYCLTTFGRRTRILGHCLEHIQALVFPCWFDMYTVKRPSLSEQLAVPCKIWTTSFATRPKFRRRQLQDFLFAQGPQSISGKLWTRRRGRTRTVRRRACP